MAIVIPYQSQAGIQTANAGPAAQYRSASAFVTPGQENLGRGMQQLAAGVDRLGGVLFGAEIQKRQEQMELALLEDMQAFQSESQSWTDDYQQQNQGKNALNAEDDAKSFYDERISSYLQKWDGNQTAQLHIQRNAGNIAVAGVNAMRDYGNRQQDVYRLAETQTQYGLAQRAWMDPNSTAEARNQSLTDWENMTRYNNQRAGLPLDQAQLEIDAGRHQLLLGRFTQDIQGKLDSGDIAGARGMMTGARKIPSLPADIKDAAARAAAAYGIDPGLVMSMIGVESGGNPDAESPVGARGLMQLMPDTQKELENKYGIKGKTAEGNIFLGTAYLKEMLARYDGDERLALMAYNWGMGHVDDWIKRGSRPEEMPQETQKYISLLAGGGVSPSLTPTERMGFEKQIDAREKSLTNEASAIYREQAPDAFAWFARSGDSSALGSMRERLVATGQPGSQALRDFDEQLAFYQLMQPYFSGSSEESFTEQQQSIQVYFSAHTTPENAAKMADYEKTAMRAFQQNVEAFRKDPAGYAMQLQSGDFASDAERAKDSIARQLYAAQGMPNFVPRVLPNDVRDNIKTTINDQDVPIADKMTLLAGLNSEYGDLWINMAKELDLPPASLAAVNIAMDSQADMQGVGRELLAASLMADADVPRSDLTAQDIRTVLSDNGYYQNMMAMAAAFPTNQALVAGSRGMEDAFSRLVKIKGKDALAPLSEPYSFYESPSAVIRLPVTTGVEADTIAYGLEAVSENLAKYRPDLDDKTLRGAQLRGVWRSAGMNAELIADGQLVVSIHIAEAMQQYRDSRAAQLAAGQQNMDAFNAGYEMGGW